MTSPHPASATDLRPPDAISELTAIQADDVLLDTIGSGGQTTDNELACLLAAWRRGVLADPIPELDTPTVIRLARTRRGLPPRSYLLWWVTAAWVVSAAIVLLTVIR